MELKQKFDEAMTKRDHIKSCEIIADNHAIDFAEWLMEECYYQYDDKWLYRNTDEVYNTKQILKIFKNED